MDAELWILQDKTSPAQKVWGLILADDGSAFSFYGGTFSPRLIVSRLDRRQGLARLAEKKKKYQTHWYEKVAIPEGKTPDVFCESAYAVFFVVGTHDENVPAFLRKHRSKIRDRQAEEAGERAKKRINAAIQQVPTLPWAF